VPLSGPPRRIVSLVPSLTEAVAVSLPPALVGATDFCVEPRDLDVARVGGSKYPDLGRVRAAVPDLVLANAEENRPQDVAALRADGIPVWVTYPRTLDEALASLGRLMSALGAEDPPWLAAARASWSEPFAGVRRTAVIPVWRRPWVVLGSDTFAGDVLARLGVDNVYASAPERYPRPPLAQLRAADADLLVLPDEPYRFTDDDGPEAFPGQPYALVSGRYLTWYGPSLASARAVLTSALQNVCS
jgi:ABC-type Fe3+-hydroxamate transport system substrate-binding protein